MTRLNHLITGMRAVITGTAVAVSLTACDSAIYDGEGDCSIGYKVKLVYERNMEFSDLFAQRVRSVELYAFDPATHRLVWSGSGRGDGLAQSGNTIGLPLEAGTYDLVAWCGHLDADHFTLGGENRAANVETIDQLVCRMRRAEGSMSDIDLEPLYHGMVSRIELPDTFGTVITRILPVMKNTNRIHVELVTDNGHPLNPDDYDIAITDRNGLMNYDNTLLDDDLITFTPWNVDNSGNDGFTASMTIGRLMADGQTHLTVTRRSDNKALIALTLPHYLAEAREQYTAIPMDEQEYLDRQDEYTLRFYIAGAPGYESWNINAGIYINAWRVVINSSDF